MPIQQTNKRAQRVVLEVPIAVSWSQDGTPLSEYTQTLNVNSRGGLITMGTPLAKGQKVRLINQRTKKEIKCTVAHVQSSAREAERWEVGISFDEPAPRYWGLYFPPEDWDSTARKLPQVRRPEK